MNNKNNTQLVEPLLKLTMHHLIEDSNLNLKFIEARMKFYQTLLADIKDDKPLFFQKKKLVEYNSKLEEYTGKIDELSTQFNEELKMLEELYEQI